MIVLRKYRDDLAYHLGYRDDSSIEGQMIIETTVVSLTIVVNATLLCRDRWIIAMKIISWAFILLLKKIATAALLFRDVKGLRSLGDTSPYDDEGFHRDREEVMDRLIVLIEYN